MTKPFEQMTDEDHVRFMLDGGDRGLIDRLHETDDVWTFGGGVQLAKAYPVLRFGDPDGKGEFVPLSSHCRFELTPFSLADTGASGFALWLQTGPRDETSPSLRNRSLCGWVPPDREAEAKAWAAHLNEAIREHVAKQQAAWNALTDEQREQAINEARFEASVRFLERVGIPMPGRKKEG